MYLYCYKHVENFQKDLDEARERDNPCFGSIIGDKDNQQDNEECEAEDGSQSLLLDLDLHRKRKRCASVTSHVSETTYHSHFSASQSLIGTPICSSSPVSSCRLADGSQNNSCNNSLMVS